MVSFSNLLRIGLKGELKVAYPSVAKTEFHCVRRIDPSFFDKSHNVIELFLANLYNDFSEFREKVEASSETDTQERIVLELFAESQKKMSEMTKAQDDGYDVLEKLQNLSAGVKLGGVIRELVQAFMEYINKRGGILVLQIDDIDLNSSMAAEMMEQIRKFLIQPNIVILLAAKLDQLSSAKEIQLREEFSALPKANGQDDEFEEMVDAYLTKLLPHQQRVYMPDGIAYFYQPVVVVREFGNEDRYPSVRQMIPELIFKKTRYLFYNSPDRTSYIVPDNLRDLRFLVSLLYNMQDYWRRPEEDKHRESNRYNKLLFRKYLYENWAPNNLDSSMQKMVKRILEIQDTEQVNAVVVACLKDVFKGALGSTQRVRPRISQNEIELIMDTANANYNIAAGDVLDVIDTLENSESNIQKLAVLVLGDTNSCLSVIGAKRLHIPIFHMEAGNRCKDECLPEETNRRIVDIISDVNMAYSEHARRYLADCGLPKERTYVTGSPMAEVLHENLAEIEASDVHARLSLEKGRYILLSAHREENIDTEKNFLSLFTAINAMAAKYDMPILYSCHPRGAVLNVPIGQWHSLKSLESGTVLLECKDGAYEPLGDEDILA